MKIRLTSYTFDASAKTVTATQFSDVTLAGIQLIVNVTDGIVIYNFADAAKGGTLSTDTLTLEHDTTSMDDADELMICVEDGVIQALPTGAATSAKQDAMTTALGSPFQAGGSIANTAFTANAGTNLNTSALLTESDFDAKTGSLTEGAPASDTASSGLNGRLQRIAQRISSLITALGSPFQAGGSIGNTTFAATQATGSNLHTVVDSGTITTVSTVTAVTAISSALPAGNNNIGDVDIASIAAGDNNIGNVDVLTLPNQYTEDAAAAANPVGNMTMAVASMSTDPVVADGDNVALHATTSGHLRVEDTSVVTVLDNYLPELSNAIGSEDEASIDGHTGQRILAVRKATPANTSDTDGDYEFLQMSAGRLWGSVKVDTALPAGTNNIGDVDVVTVNGVAPAFGTGARGATVQRVTIATDDVVPITDNAGSLTVDQPTGTNLHTVVDSGTITAVTSITNAVTVSQGTATNLKVQSENYVGGSAVSLTNPLITQHRRPAAYLYNIVSQAHVASANAVHWDLFNADASLIVRVVSIRQIPNITTAVVGIVFDWLLERTTAVGTGGSAQTAWLADLSDTALDADITCRSKPAGGATQSVDLFNYSISSEETSAATIQIASQGGLELVPDPLLQYNGGKGIVLRPSQGIRCVQITNSNAGNTGWLIAFTVE